MQWLKARLVDDWRQAKLWWSVRLHTGALLYLGVYELMPALSPDIAHLLPSPLQGPVIGAYALLGLAARLIAQRKPDAA